MLIKYPPEIDTTKCSSSWEIGLGTLESVRKDGVMNVAEHSSGLELSHSSCGHVWSSSWSAAPSTAQVPVTKHHLYHLFFSRTSHIQSISQSCAFHLQYASQIWHLNYVLPWSPPSSHVTWPICLRPSSPSPTHTPGQNDVSNPQSGSSPL